MSNNQGSVVNENTTASANTSNHGVQDHVMGGTTVFSNMENVVETSFSVPPVIDDIVIRDQSIVDFMAKPYLLSSFQDQAVANSTLYSSTIFSAISANSLWTNKFQGFRLFRGTAVFTLTLNTQPFVQGRALMHFLPSTYLIGTTLADSSYVAMHNAGLATKTQQPNVELDYRDTVAVLKIPYVTPYYFAELADLKTDWGSIYVTQLAARQSGAGQTFGVGNFSLYLHFEDWEMAAPMVPQGPSSKKFTATRKSKSAVVEEKEKVSTVSGILSLGSSIASSLASVPLLTPLAQPASWVLKGAAGLASYFGYSKPNQSPTLIMGNTNSGQYYYSATGNGMTLAAPLSLDSENAITISDKCSLTPEDEMSFNYLKRVCMLYSTVNWDDSAVSGTTIGTYAIRPDNFSSSGTRTNGGKSVTYYMAHPVAYLSKYFQLYRGSIQIKLKFVCTQFHSGRLQITYTPKPYVSGGSITAPTLSTSNVALRQIVDIRDDQEVLLNIPYINNQDYLPMDWNMGQLSLIVLNELLSPTTCAANIDILFYVTFGEDFELAAPVQKNNLVPFSPQMGEDRILTNQGVGNSSVVPLNPEHQQNCVGEAFTSVRQLLLRFGFLRSISTYNSTCQYLYFWPWFTSVPALGGTGTITCADIGGDAYNSISQMYAFYRGGMRVAQCSSTTGRPALTTLGSNSLFGTTAICQVMSSQGVIDWKDISTAYKTGPIPATFVDASGNMCMASVPYYSYTRMSARANFQSVSPGIAQSDFHTQPVDLIQFNSNSAIAANAWAVSRAINDDFQFTYFVGCPPYLVTNPA